MRKARSPAELSFTGHDRRRLAMALHQTQETKVCQRVQAALLIEQGYSAGEVARIIGSQQRSVYYWMKRFLDRHRVADLYDASRTGRPRTGAQIAKARILRELARDLLKLGYNTTILSRELAVQLDIVLIWLPKHCLELNAMDQLWKELKGDLAASRRFRNIV